MFQKEQLDLEQLQDRKLKRTRTAVTQRKKNFLFNINNINALINPAKILALKNQHSKTGYKVIPNLKIASNKLIKNKIPCTD